MISGGNTIGNKGLFLKNTPAVIPQAEVDDWHKLTPKEKMQRKKEMEIKKRQEQLAEAAKGASMNYQRAKEQQYSQLYAGYQQQPAP